MTFVADRGDVAHRLDQAVQRHVPGAFGLSRSGIQKLVASGRVLVNGAPARRPAQRLAAGDLVAIDAVAAPPPDPPAAESLPLDVVYEDDDLIVVCKPSGMVAHPTSRQRSGTVVNAVLGRTRAGDGGWSPRLVQRLDRDTSGLMIIARRADVHTALQRNRDDIVKDYLAVVWGRPSPRQGATDTALGRDPLDRRRMMVRDDGSPSHTTYAVLAHSTGDARGLSLVRCRLGTEGAPFPEQPRSHPFPHRPRRADYSTDFAAFPTAQTRRTLPATEAPKSPCLCSDPNVPHSLPPNVTPNVHATSRDES